MFGYVRIHKPTLTCGGYDIYRGIYCSLCRELGRRYSPLGQAALQYDAAFLALLGLALAEEPPSFRRGRCCWNPLKRCPRCRESGAPSGVSPGILSFTADAAILLTYYKWRDALADGRWWERALLRLPAPLFHLLRRRARRRQPEADRSVRIAMTAQRLTERESHAAALSLDQAAHPSAQALGDLCALLPVSEVFRPALHRLGYLLGRWVYLVDAADDFGDDLRRNRYNPFSALSDLPPETRAQRTREALNTTAEQLLPALDDLPLCRFRPIIENILAEGLPDSEQKALTRLEHPERPHGRRRNGAAVEWD
ncbi:MAG: DUF5685 family protein [Oscillospiraceae bacterium]|nr:DUF5685 family protein [Oscillospiraceae bacterium]